MNVRATKHILGWIVLVVIISVTSAQDLLQVVQLGGLGMFVALV